MIAEEAFHGDMFRAYDTEDVVGVCVGGSLKNVMAIAAASAPEMNFTNKPM